jgi:hypothetical protein
MVGPVPLTLGFKADGDKAREVHTLTIHPDKADALAQSPITVIHAPTTVDQVMSMRPYEQFSDKGTQSIGIGGNAAIGFGAGPAAMKAGGSVYYQITGNLSRDIERLDGNKVRVRISREDGKSDIKALSASIGLDAGKIGGDNALVQKAAPLVAQMAQAGISATWEKTQTHDTVFDATIDLSTPQGRAAMQHLLNNELAETQKWAGYEGSGVTLNSEINTDVSAQTKRTDLNIGPLNKENVSRFLDRQQHSLSPNDVTFTEAVDQVRSNKALFPWNQSGRVDLRFVHETKVMNTGPLPDVGEISTEKTMTVHLPEVGATRPATLADAAGMLGMRFRISHDDTSQNSAVGGINTGIAVMQAMGYSKEELGQIDDARDAAASSLAPKKEGVLLGIGDKRFGKTAVDVEGFLGPKGFEQLLKGRSQNDFKNAYLEASGVMGSPLSTAGAKTALEQALGAQLVPAKAGGFDVMKNGQRIGALTDKDITTVRDQMGQLVGMGHSFDPNSPSAMRITVGHWNQAPDQIIQLSQEQLAQGRDELQRAGVYAQTMTQAQKLYTDNQPPAKGAQETDAAYQTRLQQWQDASLFKKPDVYFQKMDDLFKQAIESDKTPATGLATMQLAGPAHIYGKANVELPPDAVKTMIDKGRADVQRFGAVDALANLGARIDPNGNLMLPSAPQNLDVATAAAKQLFGPNVQATRNGGAVTFTGMAWPSQDFKNGLTQLLVASQAQHGSLKMIGLSADKQNETLRQVFGDSAVIATNGQIYFDNRNYGIVHFGDALSPFGNAFGVYKPGDAPPMFPALVPIQDQGVKQAYDLNGLVARHNGAESHWGDQFAHLEYLHGANEDLAATQPNNPNAWILQ